MSINSTLVDYYNVSAVADSTNPVTLVQTIINVLTGGVGGHVFLFGIAILVFIALKTTNQPISSVLAIGGFLMTVISIFFRILGFVGTYYIFVFAFLMVIGIALAIYENG